MGQRQRQKIESDPKYQLPEPDLVAQVYNNKMDTLMQANGEKVSACFAIDKACQHQMSRQF